MVRYPRPGIFLRQVDLGHYRGRPPAEIRKLLEPACLLHRISSAAIRLHMYTRRKRKCAKFGKVVLRQEIPADRCLVAKSCGRGIGRKPPVWETRQIPEMVMPIDQSDSVQPMRHQYVARPPDRSKTAAVVKLFSRVQSHVIIAAASSSSRKRPRGIFESM